MSEQDLDLWGDDPAPPAELAERRARARLESVLRFHDEKTRTPAETLELWVGGERVVSFDPGATARLEVPLAELELRDATGTVRCRLEGGLSLGGVLVDEGRLEVELRSGEERAELVVRRVGEGVLTLAAARAGEEAGEVRLGFTRGAEPMVGADGVLTFEGWGPEAWEGESLWLVPEGLEGFEVVLGLQGRVGVRRAVDAAPGPIRVRAMARKRG